jgi:hypothetical protein
LYQVNGSSFLGMTVLRASKRRWPDGVDKHDSIMLKLEQYVPKNHSTWSLHVAKIQKMMTNLNNNQQPPQKT